MFKNFIIGFLTSTIIFLIYINYGLNNSSSIEIPSKLTLDELIVDKIITKKIKTDHILSESMVIKYSDLKESDLGYGWDMLLLPQKISLRKEIGGNRDNTYYDFDRSYVLGYRDWEKPSYRNIAQITTLGLQRNILPDLLIFDNSYNQMTNIFSDAIHFYEFKDQEKEYLEHPKYDEMINVQSFDSYGLLTKRIKLFDSDFNKGKQLGTIDQGSINFYSYDEENKTVPYASDGKLVSTLDVYDGLVTHKARVMDTRFNDLDYTIIDNKSIVSGRLKSFKSLYNLEYGHEFFYLGRTSDKDGMLELRDRYGEVGHQRFGTGKYFNKIK